MRKAAVGWTLLLGLLPLSCGGGDRSTPAPAEPPAQVATEAAAGSTPEPAADPAEVATPDPAATAPEQSLTTAGVDPPMLPPRPADAEEAPLELEPWKRLDGPPSFEEVVPWTEAHQHVGRRMAVEGTIVRTYNSGRACFLNFHDDWKGKFHAVIFASSFPEYDPPPEELFLDRRVRLIGKISEHQGAPQIVIEEARQVALLD